MGSKTLDRPIQGELSAVSAELNSISLLTNRAREGTLGWVGPLLLMVGRSMLILAAQAVTVVLIWLHSRTWSWNGAAKWWTVYGTLVDTGCLALMASYTRKEGIKLRDLIGRVRLRWGRDVFLGLGILVLVFPFFLIAAPMAMRLVYGAGRPPSLAGLADARILPLWGVVYSLSLWWLIWSPTEEMTYRGYVLPRLEVLCGNRWTAVGIVSFWWTLQHVFLPFILDWKFILWRFLTFLPGVVVLVLPSLKMRRLAPFVIAHWPMDIAAVLMTLKF